MKRLQVFKAMVVAILYLSAFTVNAQEKKKETKEVTYCVEMDCQSCVNKITRNIAFEKGVKDLKVDFEAQKVTVKYRADKTNSEILVSAFEKLDFKAVESNGGDDGKANVTKHSEGHSHKH